MNKDVIYIEPEDDITDIITKIENSKEKIVALVPPKKAGVFRSVVNIKLISKVGKSSEKTIVLVTTDPSIVKLAASTQLPVTKDLKTAPVIPTMEEVAENVTETEVVEVDEEAEEPTEEEATTEDEAEGTEEASENTTDEGSDDVEPEETAEEKPEKKKKEPKTKGKKGGKNPIEWIKNHKKLSIVCGIGIVILIAFLIWALFIAPAVDVAVTIKTESKNFSENVSFTETASDENVEEGKFYIEEKKVEAVQEINFDATGQKNNGERASGKLAVAVYFPLNVPGQVPINVGDRFTYSGLNYYADSSLTLEYNGSGKEGCANKDNANELIDKGCKKMGRISVVAAEPGDKYNVDASNVGWSSSTFVDVISSDEAMTGGTNDLVTVVQQSDIEAAKAKLNSSNEDENKAKLFESIDENYFVIESSFSQNSDSVSATPGAGEEVKNGVQATLKATTEATVYVVDKTKLEEFINKKVELEEDQKIFEIKNMRFENVTKFAAGGTAKLKAQYYVGPKLTEGEIVDKIKGKGLGDAQREIRDIYGVTDVKINKSVPWVMRVPNDSNKVNVSIGFPEEQNKEEGEEGEQKDENKQDENKQNEEKTDN